MSARSDDDVLIAKLGRLRGRIVMLDDRALLDTAMLRLATLTRERDEARRVIDQINVAYDDVAGSLINVATVTPEMVERAAEEIAALESDVPWRLLSEMDRDHCRTLARRALTTALGCQPPVLSCGDGEQETG